MKGPFEHILCFDINHSKSCFGLLSCWKENFLETPKPLVASNKLSIRIILDLAPSIFPSTLTCFPVPADEKPSHNMALPPPCFTMGMVYRTKKVTSGIKWSNWILCRSIEVKMTKNTFLLE
ncbi:hypothetical protein CHARACLAT_003315 [Characodon lateralis]|uniref:Uncharacterized protein n=1 Tax=Characodon lateralis TaxID=208331 RepID=A0ABU7DMY9_9TELE|nr:hypothetical protein [Characodon lateralis]